MRREGFTIVELLVVISVIVILMLIVLPVLRSAREVARRTKCAHHLTGIYSGILLYVADYRDILPNAGALHRAKDNPSPGQLPHLHHVLRPYVTGDDSGSTERLELFHCPSDGPEELFRKRFGSSYQYRGKDEPRTPNPCSGQPLDVFPNPVALGIVRDARGWHRLSKSGGWTLATTMGQQVLFLDGHVQYFGDVARHAAGIW